MAECVAARPDDWEQPGSSEDSQRSSSSLPVSSPAHSIRGHHALHYRLARHCQEAPFPHPKLRNTGLANGNTDKHSSSFKLRTAMSSVLETSSRPPYLLLL